MTVIQLIFQLLFNTWRYQTGRTHAVLKPDSLQFTDVTLELWRGEAATQEPAWYRGIDHDPSPQGNSWAHVRLAG